MLKYDKIDVTEGIDLDKINKSKECMFCHYWYYLNKIFTYGPFIVIIKIIIIIYNEKKKINKK